MANNSKVGKVFNIAGGGSGGSGYLKLEAISVTAPPNKTVYKSGESFDPDGMVVTAQYGYGITSEVTGYSVTPSVLTDDITEVTVSYTENRVTRTATTPVTVEKVLSAITVTKQPDKTEYDYMETFDPDGMIVTAEFSDGSTAPVEDYTYPATAFSTLGEHTIELTYTYEGVTKTTSLTVTANAIELDIPTQQGSLVYDGTTKTPVWDGYDSTKMTVSEEIAGEDAGTYTAKFTLVYGYVFPDGGSETTVDWTIERAIIPALPTQSNFIAADGSEKTPTWDDYDESQLTIDGDLSGTEAGDYEVSFTPTDNYQWWDGSITAKETTWTISEVLVPIPTQKGVIIYDGASKTPEWDDFDTEYSTVQVEPAIDAGEHTATFSLLAGAWEDGTTEDKTVTWVINRAAIGTIPTQSGTLTYNGESQSVALNNYDSGKMTLGGKLEAIDAGTYSATVTPKANYQWSDGSTTAKTVSWTIGRASLTIPSQSESLTYNGSAQSVILSNYDSNKMTLGDTASAANAGTYTATVTLKDTTNYQWSDGTTEDKSISWSIAKAAGSSSLSATSLSFENTSSSNITVTRSGDGAVSATSSDTSVADVNVSGTTITVTPKATGSATITVKVAADANYNAPSDKTCSVTVSLLPAKTTLNNTSWPDISKVSDAGQAANYWAVGDTKSITINGIVGNTTFSNLAIAVYIVGFNHNAEAGKDNNRIHFQIGKINGIKVGLVDAKYNSSVSSTGYFSMNSSSTNSGGWNGSQMRSNIMGGGNTPTSPKANSLMAALPSDLRSVMKSVTKYTDNHGGGQDNAMYITATTEYLCLPAEFEIYGARGYANSSEQNAQAQYQYYKNGNSKIHYRYDATSSACWAWLRSPRCGYSYVFCSVNADGGAYYFGAYVSGAVAPLLFI